MHVLWRKLSSLDFQEAYLKTYPPRKFTTLVFQNSSSLCGALEQSCVGLKVPTGAYIWVDTFTNSIVLDWYPQRGTEDDRGGAWEQVCYRQWLSGRVSVRRTGRLPPPLTHTHFCFSVLVKPQGFWSMVRGLGLGLEKGQGFDSVLLVKVDCVKEMFL